MSAKVHVQFCDHGHPTRGEVRLLPTGGGGNLILCRGCFAKEIAYRRGQNARLRNPQAYDLPQWRDLEVYTSE